MSKKLYTIGMCALMVGAANAETLSFTDFNNVDGLTNGVSITGGTLNSVTRTTVDTGNYNFAFNYTDTLSNTLTFDLLVQGWTDGTITTTLAVPGTGTGGTATIGTTSAAVGEVTGGSIVGAGFGVGTSMPSNSSLQFTVGNLLYSGGSATFDGFSDANVQETASNSHQTVVGVATGLFERDWNTATEQGLTTGDVSELYISAASGGEARWGVSTLDFGITTTVIPEPSSFAMLLGGMSVFVVMSRRKRR